MARQPINNAPGTADSLKVGADKINAMTAELYTADAAAGTASLRTLGTGAQQAAAGNDARLSDQRTPLNGSVTTEKIADQNVTAPKLSFSAGPRFMARAISGAGPGTEITATQLTAALDTVTRSAKGLAPAAGGTSGTTNFLREDSTWAAVGPQTPTGAAGGQLGGTYPNPDVRGIRETSGPTTLTIGAIPDQTFLFRNGNELIGDEAATVGEFTFATLPSASGNEGRMAIVTDLNNALVRAGGSPVRWRPVTGRQCIFRAIANATPQAGLVVSGTSTETDFTDSLFTLPAGLLSATGGIDVNATAIYSPAPTAGTVRIRFGSGSVFSPGLGTVQNYNPRIHIRNRNVTNAQFSTGGMTLTTGGTATFLATTIDTTASVVVKVVAEPGAGTPTATLYFVEYYWVD